LNELPPHPVVPGMIKIAAALAIMLATGSSASVQAQSASSGLPRTAHQEQGSQLLPEAQPPFAPKPDSKPAQANGTQGADRFPAPPRSSAVRENAGWGSDTPARPAQCDYRLCASTYRSFDASNCTYQPYTGGPRRLCER
jgi:hypothetical protein